MAPVDAEVAELPLPEASRIGRPALGYLVEKKCVGRMSIFGNGVALNINYLPFSKTLPQWLGFYLDGALLMAAIGILSYASRSFMPKWFYQIGWLYSSFAAGLVVLIVRL